jgi:tRNA threonylcarbamoyladenosine biosynthesis protein TsaB
VNVLGFDTSTAATAGCLFHEDHELEASPGPERLTRAPAHAQELMPALAGLVADAGIDWNELDAIAVGVGPGGFTGLRIGVATARGLAGAHDLPLRPVSSLRALAEGIEAPLRLPLIDARRGEVFAALYERDEERWAPFVAAPQEVARRVADAGVTPLAAGDGSIRFRDVLEAAGVEVAPGGSEAHVVRGLHVCRLALSVPDQPPEAVLPHYLRLPDAQPSQ